MILRTERLHLRPLTVEDAPALFAARGDPNVRDGERRDCLVYGRLRDGTASIALAMV